MQFSDNEIIALAQKIGHHRKQQSRILRKQAGRIRLRVARQDGAEVVRDEVFANCYNIVANIPGLVSPQWNSVSNAPAAKLDRVYDFGS